MATTIDIRVSIPTDHAPQLLEDMAAEFRYNDTKIEDRNGPGKDETKAQFAKRHVAEWLKDIYMRHRKEELEATRNAAIEASMEADSATLEGIDATLVIE